MNFVFLMDPLETVIMEKDTSFILMLGAHRKRHCVYYLPDGGIILKNGRLFVKTFKIIPQKVKEQPFIRQQKTELSENNIDAVFIRSDPPFDEQYLLNSWLLDRLPKHIPVINRPSGIRTTNEKIWATQFQSIIPPTLVGRNKEDLFNFLTEIKNVIAKPTNGFGGQSVFHIKHNDENAKVILETLSQNWSKEIILQQFVTEAQNGDKRILLLNGEPLGAVLRVHPEGDHRNNFFSGGKPVKTDINSQDKKIINALKPGLQELGLFFVGIDILGDYLIEVNVTSPTCLQEMNRLYNKNLEIQVIEFVEQLVLKKAESNSRC